MAEKRIRRFYRQEFFVCMGIQLVRMTRTFPNMLCANPNIYSVIVHYTRMPRILLAALIEFRWLLTLHIFLAIVPA
jgi:hypothetical protein